MVSAKKTTGSEDDGGGEDAIKWL